MIKTQTSTGVKTVFKTTQNGLSMVVSHPSAGDVTVTGLHWGTHQGREGVVGKGHINRVRHIVVATVPQVDWKAAEAEQTECMKEKAHREAAKAEQDRQSAIGECPKDHTIARCLWTNGDLMSGKYRTEDGTEVLASDQLRPHHGWYFIRIEEVEKVRAEKTVRCEKEAKRQEDEHARRRQIFNQAHETGKPVVLDTWTETRTLVGEEYPGEEGDYTFLCTRYAQPDGGTSVRETNTY